jgi:hypothetical protein
MKQSVYHTPLASSRTLLVVRPVIIVSRIIVAPQAI